MSCSYCKLYTTFTMTHDDRIAADVDVVFSRIAEYMKDSVNPETGGIMYGSVFETNHNLWCERIMDNYRSGEMAEKFAVHFIAKLIRDAPPNTFDCIGVYVLITGRMGVRDSRLSIYHIIDQLIRTYGYTGHRVQAVNTVLEFLNEECIYPTEVNFCPSACHMRDGNFQSYSAYVVEQYKLLVSMPTPAIHEGASESMIKYADERTQWRKSMMEYYEFIFNRIIEQDIEEYIGVVGKKRKNPFGIPHMMR